MQARPDRPVMTMSDVGPDLPPIADVLRELERREMGDDD